MAGIQSYLLADTSVTLFKESYIKRVSFFVWMENEEIIEQIKKVDWQYFVNRREAILMSSLTDQAYAHFEEWTHLPWHFNSTLRLPTGDVLFSAKEMKGLHSIFSQGDLSLFTDFQKRLVRCLKRFEAISKKIEKTDCTPLSPEELQQLLETFVKAGMKAHTFLAPMPVADKVLSSRIMAKLPEASEQQKQEWLGILTFPDKENEHVKEEKSFYSLAAAYHRKNFQERVQKHLATFGWIGARWYWLNKAWTEQNILSRLEDFLSQHKNPKKEIENLHHQREEEKNKFKILCQELGITPESELGRTIALAKGYAFLRTWRTDVIYHSGYRARNLFYEIAGRAGMNRDDVVYLSTDELLATVKTAKMAISAPELELRKASCCKAVLQGKYLILAGKEWEKKIRDALHLPTESGSEIQGKIAYPGKVQGKVKLVLTAEDISKVARGDILVAVMTFPHFIAAMEKAAAFITDEGGILCHAAIVSREMKKPCIIATRIATKVLKDGEMIEVDAEKGIVKKINSSISTRE